MACGAAVALGGALGALLRHLISEAVPSGWQGVASAALGITWSINVLGSGLLAALPAVPAIARRPVLTAGVGAGLLGGFTTFSAYAGQARALLAHGQTTLAGVYLLGTALGCVSAVVVTRIWIGERASAAAPSHSTRRTAGASHGDREDR